MGDIRAGQALEVDGCDERAVSPETTAAGFGLGDGTVSNSPARPDQTQKQDGRSSEMEEGHLGGGLDGIAGSRHGMPVRDPVFGTSSETTYRTNHGGLHGSLPNPHPSQHRNDAVAPRLPNGYGSYSLSAYPLDRHADGSEALGLLPILDPSRHTIPPMLPTLPHLSETATYLDGMADHRRQARRRTKTGCLTCRKRRIKCDETHPTCTNCIKSKRTCLGYDPNFRSLTHDDNYRPQYASQQASESRNAGSSPESAAPQRMRIASLLDGRTVPKPVSSRARELASMLSELFSSRVFVDGLEETDKHVTDAFNVLGNASGGAYAERRGHVTEAIVWTAVKLIYPSIPVPTILFREEPTHAHAVVLYRVRLLESCVARTALPSAPGGVEDELEVWRIIRKVVEGREELEWWQRAEGMEKVLLLLAQYRHCSTGRVVLLRKHLWGVDSQVLVEELRA